MAERASGTHTGTETGTHTATHAATHAATPHAATHYVPAAGHDFLLPLYDPLQWLLGGNAARGDMIRVANLSAGQRALDIGCGTGSLVVALGRAHPDVEVVGLDPDPKALARARRKLARGRLAVQLEQGFSQSLPFADAGFDRVFSTFMFHHLDRDVKRGTLAEARRVLVPSGELHLLDFAAAGAHAHGLLAKLLHAPEDMRENDVASITELMREAGFASAREEAHRSTLFGRVAHFVGVVPASAPSLHRKSTEGVV